MPAPCGLFYAQELSDCFDYCKINHKRVDTTKHIRDNSPMPNKRHRLTASTLTHRLIKNLTDVATQAQASVTRCLAVHPHKRESLIEAVQPRTETHQGGHEAPDFSPWRQGHQVKAHCAQMYGLVTAGDAYPAPRLHAWRALT